MAPSDVAIEGPAGAIPTGIGGTIVDGTYIVGSITFYEGSALEGSGLSLNETFVISGGGTHSELVADNLDQPHFTKTSTITTEGTGITFDDTCTTVVDEPELAHSSYTANGSEIILYLESIGLSIGMISVD